MTRTPSRLLPWLIVAGLLFVLEGCQSTTLAPRPPNIVLIMADDMGFSDLGSYGGEIKTPYLDLLARQGLRFTQFYNAARCCPTRASLLTGLYPHEAGMGGMVSSVDSTPEEGPYQGYLNETAVTMAEALKRSGYRAYLAGKWHVGEKPEHWPLKRGFDRYFGLISGASSYYEVIEDQPRVRQMVLDDTPWTPPETGFYMTDAISDHAVTFISDHVDIHRRNSPFLLYVPYTAPHWPLHALPEDISRYENMYKSGWDVIRKRRYDRQVRMGLFDRKMEYPERPENIPAWDDVADKDVWSRRMAVYAAMVDRMDQGIGRILKVLEETRLIRNTIIIFLSDNGGSPEDVTGRNLHQAESEIGARGSYDAYRAPWANVSNTPFRYYKSWVHEGGIATPFIAYWNRGIKEKGRIIREPHHVVDLMATVLDAAGIDRSDLYGDSAESLLTGQSLMPIFEGDSTAVADALYWEHLGARAVRQGDWKLVAGRNNAEWELYNLKNDRNELNDLARIYPEKVSAMEADWRKWADRVGVRK